MGLRMNGTSFWYRIRSRANTLSCSNGIFFFPSTQQQVTTKMKFCPFCWKISSQELKIHFCYHVWGTSRIRERKETWLFPLRFPSTLNRSLNWDEKLRRRQCITSQKLGKKEKKKIQDSGIFYWKKKITAKSDDGQKFRDLGKIFTEVRLLNHGVSARPPLTVSSLSGLLVLAAYRTWEQREREREYDYEQMMVRMSVRND